MSHQPYRVLIIYKCLPQYRVEFFELLRTELQKHNITLHFIYGDADVKEREDRGSLSWAIFRKNSYLGFGTRKLIWQPCLREVKSADLVIVEQADKLLLNPILMLRRALGLTTFAFWGHGINYMKNVNDFANKLKMAYVNHCDWWFAYTKGIESMLIKNGYPGNRITILQNSIDTRKMHSEYLSINDSEIEEIRRCYDINSDNQVLIYCGAFYKEKSIDFLLDAVDLLIQRGVKIHLFIIGGGPSENELKYKSLGKHYIHFVGPQFGRQKAKYFRLADLFLLPGAIGLAILDSFAYQTPIVTTKDAPHGPERNYLIDGINGITVENNLDAYSTKIMELLSNREILNELKSNCEKELDYYSNEKMVANFCDGILKVKNIYKHKAKKMNSSFWN